ncbi:mechanosensitive ion channel protein 10-like [Eucalyptus grandis]|uniref:mechanosensitive ion channel protein 10-like n=1 Tax=Eucalyptus grandis TaxID=71139 RepID=UPI00192E89FD|nr:mechanosensitive ion channel protein 10-like [Eucalyptus grandis]
MEVNASPLEKKEANEVVLMISGVECQSRGSSPKPNTEPIELENPLSSSQISNLTSPSAMELTQSIPTPSELLNIQAGKSISSSTYAKLKSRSMELPHPSDTSATASKDAVELEPSTFPVGPVPSPAAEEEDNEHVSVKEADLKTVSVAMHRICVSETLNSKSQVMSGKMKFVLAQLVMFVCITGLLIASLTIRVLRNTVIWHVHLWGWCLLMLAIFCGRLLTHWLITLLISLIERKYLLKRNVLYFLVELKNSAKAFAWLGLVFLAWVWLIDHRVKGSRLTTGILNRVTRALASCLPGAALWLIKTFLIQLLAASFQHKRFFYRIQDDIFQYYMIGILSNPMDPKKSLKVNVENLRRMKPDKVSAWTIKQLIKVIKGWDLSTLTQSLDEAEQQDEEITDEQKAKNVAKAIFKNVAKSGNKYIEEDDLLRFMPKEYVEKFFSLIPASAETRKIDESSLKSWLVNVNHERESLTLVLKRVRKTMEELNKLASAVTLIVVIIMWLLLMGLLTTQVLIFISSQILLFTFIYGDAAKKWFESIVFVYAMHPFDVKDRCIIDGVEVEVEETNTLSTIFSRNDGERIFYPNSVLASKAISNVKRSLTTSDSVEFTVDFSTSVEILEAFKDKIREYLKSKPKHWQLDHSVVFKEIADVDNSKVLKMALHVNHTANFQEALERTKRKSELVLELKKIFDELHLK